MDDQTKITKEERAVLEKALGPCPEHDPEQADRWSIVFFGMCRALLLLKIYDLKVVPDER